MHYNKGSKSLTFRRGSEVSQVFILVVNAPILPVNLQAYCTLCVISEASNGLQISAPCWISNSLVATSWRRCHPKLQSLQTHRLLH